MTTATEQTNLTPDQHIENCRALFTQAERRAAAAEAEMARFRAALARAAEAGVSTVRLNNEFGEKIVGPALQRAAVERARQEWPTMPRALAVEWVLREAGGEPLKPSEIFSILDGHGRGDSVLDVSAALQYLERNQRAHRPAYGRWLIGPEPEPQD